MFQKILVLISLMLLFAMSHSLDVYGDGHRMAEFDDSCTGTGSKQKTGALAEGCINSPEFFINTDRLTPGGKTKLLKDNDGNYLTDGSTEKTANAILGALIQKMITIMGVIALFIMTIGGGYMIFHMGEESLLSRGKTIFMWGLISLVVALSSGLLVQLVTYLLY